MKSFLIRTILIPFVLDFLSNLFSKEDLMKWKDKLITTLKKLVVDSGPKWDDNVFLPIIDTLDSMLAVGTNIDFVLDAISELVKEILNKERPEVWQDTILDFAEDVIAASETKFDDQRILPLILKLRESLNIPDND